MQVHAHSETAEASLESLPSANPLRAFGCRPWWPCVVSGTTAQGPETLRQGRLVGELVHVCVFYLILTDHMFQEPFPVNKDSIKLMKRKSLFVISGP